MSGTTSKQIDSLFESAKQKLSPNAFNAESFRDDVIEYLDAIDEEIDADPDLANQSHWNLVMDDGYPDYDGFFAVMIIHRDGLEVIAGAGNSNEVRTVCDAHSLIEGDQVRTALTERFPCQSPKIARLDAEQWLERSLGLHELR